MRRIAAWASLAMLGGAMSGIAAADDSITPSPAFTQDELTALPVSGWITNGGNVYNQRYSPLTLLNRENVAGLKEHDAIIALTAAGRNTMPGFGGVYSQADLRDVAAYIVEELRAR